MKIRTPLYKEGDEVIIKRLRCAVGRDKFICGKECKRCEGEIGIVRENNTIPLVDFASNEDREKGCIDSCIFYEEDLMKL